MMPGKKPPNGTIRGFNKAIAAQTSVIAILYGLMIRISPIIQHGTFIANYRV